MLYLCTPLSEKAGLRCTLGKPAPPRTSFSALQKARPRRRHARAVRLRTHTRVHAMCTPQDGMLLIQPDPPRIRRAKSHRRSKRRACRWTRVIQ
jgi:hypothetical protein